MYLIIATVVKSIPVVDIEILSHTCSSSSIYVHPCTLHVYDPHTTYHTHTQTRTHTHTHTYTHTHTWSLKFPQCIPGPHLTARLLEQRV